MTKKLNLSTGTIDIFSDHGAEKITDFILCEAISPRPVLYTPAVWRRWNEWMQAQARIFVKEWALNNPFILALLMTHERQLSRYDLRRIRTPQPLRPWHMCQDETAHWCVSLDGAHIQTERRMIDRLAHALNKMEEVTK